nr:MAG TPA_asm: hypothetical protein [Caudoviricetes sp.]
MCCRLYALRVFEMSRPKRSSPKKSPDRLARAE